MKARHLICILAGLVAPAALADHHGDKPAERKEETPKADVEIVIESNDQMKFDKNEIKVKEGQMVGLTLKNVGKLPKVAMGHNLVILKPTAAVQAFAMKAMTAKPNDYIPMDAETKEMMVAHTKLLGPGEEDKIVFKAPAAGTYPYICSFPGHFGVMKGVMVVEK